MLTASHSIRGHDRVRRERSIKPQWALVVLGAMSFQQRRPDLAQISAHREDGFSLEHRSRPTT